MQVEVYKNKTGEITTAGCKTYCNEERNQAGDTVTETTCCAKEKCNNVARPLFSVAQCLTMSLTLVIVCLMATLSIGVL